MKIKPEDLGKNMLPNGALIYFTVHDELTGYGRIRGVGGTPQPYLEYTYIVEPLFEIPEYKYLMILIFEYQIHPRKTTIGEVLEDLGDNPTSM